MKISAKQLLADCCKIKFYLCNVRKTAPNFRFRKENVPLGAVLITDHQIQANGYTFEESNLSSSFCPSTQWESSLAVKNLLLWEQILYWKR